MSRVRFTLPQVKDYPDSRPSACPHCGSVILNRHGKVTKRPWSSDDAAFQKSFLKPEKTSSHRS